MEKPENKDIGLVSVVDNSTEKLIDAILAEEDTAKLKDLTYLFKINIAKKNLIRLIKYYNMVDMINAQTFERLEKRPDEISNKDLISFMNSFLITIEKTAQSLGVLDDTTMGLTINQQTNEVNINMVGSSLNRDSKERVVDAIKSLMSLISESKDSENIIEVELDEEDTLSSNNK